MCDNRSEQPPGACLWNASHSTDTLTPAPVNLASNPKSTGSAAGADKADKSGRSRVFDLSFRPAALDGEHCTCAEAENLKLDVNEGGVGGGSSTYAPHPIRDSPRGMTINRGA
eukprot:1143036-Pelagomonas_calceolata.AAC.2